MNPKSDFAKLPVSARCTIIAFGLAGLAAGLYAMTFQPVLATGRILLWLVVAAASARIKVHLFKGSTLSFLTSVVLLAVIQEGPAVAVLAALCGVTVQTIFPSKKIVLHQLAFNAGMIALTVTASWSTYHAFAGVRATETISPIMMAAMFASIIYFLGNSVSVSLILALTKGMSIFHIWFNHFLFSAPSFLIAGLLSLGLSATVGTSSFLMIAALLGVISIVYYCSVRLSAQTTS